MPELLISVMAAFAVLGPLDRICGNHFGLGREFENGILAMGALGTMAQAPVPAGVLTPLFRLLGADPAMFARLLACDMGGAVLARP